MARSSGAAVVRRRLGAALRDMRERADVRIEQAANELECSNAKVSRLENGLGPAKMWEVRVLLDLYGVRDAATRARLDEWAKQTKSAGWWESDADLTSDDVDRYLAYETEAVLLRMFCTPVLPGLLQTTAYHVAHLRVRDQDLSTADAARLDRLRQVRQADLLDPATPLRLDAVIDEGAVRRQVASPEVHHRQLEWLSELLDDQTDRDDNTVTVRVLPFSSGSPGRALSAFSLLSPREAGVDPLVAFVEDAHSASWYDTEPEVAPLVALFDRLVARSLSPTDSSSLIRELVKAPRADRSNEGKRHDH